MGRASYTQEWVTNAFGSGSRDLVTWGYQLNASTESVAGQHRAGSTWD